LKVKISLASGSGIQEQWAGGGIIVPLNRTSEVFPGTFFDHNLKRAVDIAQFFQ